MAECQGSRPTLRRGYLPRSKATCVPISIEIIEVVIFDEAMRSRAVSDAVSLVIGDFMIDFRPYGTTPTYLQANLYNMQRRSNCTGRYALLYSFGLNIVSYSVHFVE
jgi:hypothetical protein